jgi:sRNA-binding protein
MRKLVLALGAVAALAIGAFGCSHALHEAKADYHQDRADRAAEHGNYYKAAREEHKANREERKADEAPLP